MNHLLDILRPPRVGRFLALLAAAGCLLGGAWSPVLAEEQTWSRLTVPGVVFEFTARDRPLAERMWPLALQDRKAVMERLRLFPSQTLRIVLAPDRETFLRLAPGMTEHSTLGIYLLGQGVIVVRSPRSNPTGNWDPRQVLRHELTHAVIDMGISGHVPLWLHEGLAILVSEELDFLNEAELMLGAVTDRLIPLEVLMFRFPHGHGPRTMAYQQAASFVRFLLRREGMGGLIRLLDVVESGMAPPEAFLFIYGSTLYGLEDQWRTELSARFSYLTVLTSSSLLGGLGVPLVLLAVWRRRRQRRRKFRQWAKEERALAAVQGHFGGSAGAPQPPGLGGDAPHGERVSEA